MQEAPLFAAARARLTGAYISRLEAFVRRQAGRAERGPLAGRGSARGAGDEFAGYRPYRSGEDARHLDWALYARLEQPFVRVHRREAGERWLVALDTSGSMGLGAPGKLQLAAEVALALAAIGQRIGASSELLALRSDGTLLRRTFARRQDLPDWIAALESLESTPDSARGLRELLPQCAQRRRRDARLFALGDFLDLEPGILRGLERPGLAIDLAQILAPHEIAPGGLGLGAARWADRESGAQLSTALVGEALARYAVALQRREESWRRAAQRHGMAWSAWSSAAPFEDVAAALIGA
jgi:uncharacterized protein (DUF58 family)